MERILREPSKDDQWSSSPGEKQQKWKRFVWKQPFTAEGNFWILCCQPCHMPHDIWGLASLTSCNQVHLPNSVHQGKVTKWKWYPCNGFCILLLSVLIFSWSIRCYYPWGSNINRCDFLIWKNLCTISIAARSSCLIVTPWKGHLLSRKNGGKNWPTPPSNGQRHQ